jgi:hypothetical protein
MRILIILAILSCSCFATSPRVGEPQPLKEKEAFLDLSKQIVHLSKSVEKQIREKYNISRDEELILTGYFFHAGDFSQEANPDSTHYFSYTFGLKSSLGYVKQEGFEGFEFPDKLEYRISYKADITPSTGIIRLLDIIDTRGAQNQSQ